MHPRVYTWFPLTLSLAGAFLFFLTVIPYLSAHPAPYRSVGVIPAVVGASLFSLLAGTLTFATNSPGRLRLLYAAVAALVGFVLFLVMLFLAYLFLYGLQ